jgi:putative redox protein
MENQSSHSFAASGGTMPLDTLIADTLEAITEDPANAQAAFSAEGTLVGVTEVDIRTGAHTFKVDEPPGLGGADIAANPVQYALASLGSCQAITYRIWAAQLGITVDSLTVRVSGDLDLRGFFGTDDSVRPGFTAVRVEVAVAGPETKERYAELAAAVDDHCPVLDLFRNPVPVSRVIVASS